jgi:hypothetical protein
LLPVVWSEHQLRRNIPFSLIADRSITLLSTKENMAQNPTGSGTAHPGRRRRNRQKSSGAASAAPRGKSAATRTSAANASEAQTHELIEARPTPQITGELALKLAIVLGISPLNRPTTCHGYANECSCDECCARVQNLSRRAVEVRQPWLASR